jgi:hypothetical protein
MMNVTMGPDSLEPATDAAVHLFDDWFDPIESGVRETDSRGFIEELIRCELDAMLSRPGAQFLATGGGAMSFGDTQRGSGLPLRPQPVRGSPVISNHCVTSVSFDKVGRPRTIPLLS